MEALRLGQGGLLAREGGAASIGSDGASASRTGGASHRFALVGEGAITSVNCGPKTLGGFQTVIGEVAVAVFWRKICIVVPAHSR
jgi:hypothetical protein